MATGQVLTTWKEIAAYMGKGVRTVQRWEEELGLPVRRPKEDRHIVLAFPAELDEWARRVPTTPKVVEIKAVFQPPVNFRGTRAENLARMEHLRSLMLDVYHRTKETREQTARLMARCREVTAVRQSQAEKTNRLRETRRGLPPVDRKDLKTHAAVSAD